MEHSNGTNHHSHHHSNGNRHHHHHNHETHLSTSEFGGELIKQSSDNNTRVCIEHLPKEFPILMTAAKSSENVIFKLDINESEHVHIEKAFNFSSSSLDIASNKKTEDHMRRVIDCFRDKKSLSDEERKRMSIILNAANDIKDLCMEKFEIVSSDDNDLFCKMIREKWDRAVDEMSQLNSKLVSSSSLSN
jgi:hypothetical protein